MIKFGEFINIGRRRDALVGKKRFNSYTVLTGHAGTWSLDSTIHAINLVSLVRAEKRCQKAPTDRIIKGP